MTKQLFLQPVDVWLFRDGKPFDAGSDHSAISLFPPMPSVVQGALRSHYLVMQGIGLSKANNAAIQAAVGTATDFKDLRLRGPFIRRGDELLFALPMDVAYGEDEQFYPLKIGSAPAGATNAQTPMLLYPPDGLAPRKFNPEGFWVRQSEMQKYLAGQPFKAERADALFEREIRHGIARNDERRVTKEGALYQVEYIRPKDGVGLHVELVQGLAQWNQNAGVMRIGGEGHAARFENKAPQKSLQPKGDLGTQFKLVFISPTYFEKGWQPADWNAHFEGGKVTLQAAALGRYISVGGYDWATDAHKAAVRYVPAGSVYYFTTDAKVKLKHDWLCDSLNGAELGQIGYGQVLIGRWLGNR